MSVLLLAETVTGEFAMDATAKAITASKPLGKISVLLCGTEAAASAAATLEGVERVIWVANPQHANLLAENVALLLQSLAADYTHIVAPASSSGKNIMPRVAALLDVMIISDVIEVLTPNTYKRPVYAGNVIQTVKSHDPKQVLTFRCSVFSAAEESSTSASIDFLNTDITAGLSSFVENRVTENSRPELGSAKVVVSGGRGVASEANFGLIEALADKLGGAVGASRAAVDAGFAPNDWQVGQTGKVIAPDLYIAVGISGAIQHLAGMKDSKVIVAINNDEDAPIFQLADYGLVADLFEVLPEFVEKL